MTSMFVIRACNAIATCALAAVSATAAAEVWLETSQHDDYVAYGDPSSIQRQGDIVKMSSMFDYKNPRRDIPGKTYLSTKRRFEYDCKNRRARAIAGSAYAKHKAEGEILASDSSKYNWTAVVADSADDYLLKFACKKFDGSQNK